MGPFHYFHISTLPRLHNIVWCRLPEGDQPGTAVRPALVRGIKREVKTNRGAVQVSYGTSNLNLNQRNHIDLVIQNAQRLNDLDLPHAVRFDLDHSNWLPWASDFFSPPEHCVSIVAGPLTQMERERLRDRLTRRGDILAL